MTSLRERVDGPSVALDFPVHMGSTGPAGESRERDGLALYDVIANREERERGVVIAALKTVAVQQARARNRGMRGRHQLTRCA